MVTGDYPSLAALGGRQVSRADRAGERRFQVLLATQIASMTGTGLTTFAIGLWVLQTTGSASQYSWLSACALIPTLLLLPWIGTWIDRWSRAGMLVVANLGPGVCTLTMAWLAMRHSLDMTTLYGLLVASALLGAAQWPTLTASMTMMVPADRLGRYSALVYLGEAAQHVLAPALAGALLPHVGLSGLVLMDALTFVAAACASAWARVPNAQPDRDGPKQPSVLQAFVWLRRRPALLQLQGFFSMSQAALATLVVFAVPYCVATGHAAQAGWTLSLAGLGMLVGTVVMAVVGPPRRHRIAWVLRWEAMSGGLMLVAAGGLWLDRTHTWWGAPWVVGATGFGVLALLAAQNASSQLVWQTRVDPSIQGRVFTARRLVAWSLVPVVYLAGGPVAEFALRPVWAGLAAPVPMADAILSLWALAGLGRGLTALVASRSQALASLDEAMDLLSAGPDDAVSEREGRR